MPPKSKNQHGLGRAIINKQAKDARQAKESGLYTTDIDSPDRLRSVTQERDLDEFLNTAQLAATDFTAERRNIQIIQSPSLAASSAHNPFLLSAEEEKKALQKHRENKDKLRVPRRPPWTKDLTHAQLERQERDAFLDWRRSLAELAEEQNLLLTPFERNLEVWRQLWRVLERSHLVVQIVDARNPLRFRCEDLESYAADIEGLEGESGTAIPGFQRKNLLLINKADLLTKEQRQKWADHFDKQGITYAFFSAANANAIQQARRQAQEAAETALRQDFGSEGEEDEGELEDIGESSEETPGTVQDNVTLAEFPKEQHQEQEHSRNDYHSDSDEASSVYFSAEEDNDERTKVLTVPELEILFLKCAPKLPTSPDGHSVRLTVGLVGYPNVGKSSTINSLIGEKKVSVSSTPGKTKHFQTIHLSPDIVLCDCPGLVFPQFAVQKAELVCDGVLPVDQLRESHGPVGLVAKRIGREVLEATYGLTIRHRGEEIGFETDEVTAEDLLVAYAIARGFARSGQGNPDESRAARYVLKDYVNAKLLFCHPPPGISEGEFNIPTKHNILRRLREAGKKKAPVTRVGKTADTFMGPNNPGSAAVAPSESLQSQVLDASFFSEGTGLSARPFVRGQEFTRARMYPHQNMVTDNGTPITGRHARLMAVLANNHEGITSTSRGKKHNKGNKRAKQRSGKGYD